MICMITNFYFCENITVMLALYHLVYITIDNFVSIERANII